MVSKFKDVERAVAYLCGYVRDHFPGSHVEVSFYPRGQGRTSSVVTDINHLAVIVRRLCRHFQGASVACDPGQHDPEAVGIQCRMRGHHVHHDQRPIAAVVACSGEAELGEADRQETRKWLQELVHSSVTDERKRKLSKYNRPPGERLFTDKSLGR